MSTDIDIDFADREQILKLIKHVPAMIKENTRCKKHNTGVYFQSVPLNPFTDLATIDYKNAVSLGWFKIDLLNVGIYSEFKSNDEIDFLLEKEPDWSLLRHKEIIEQLFHIHNHADIVIRLKPESIEQLAMVLALIRPAKKYLIGRPWPDIEKKVWMKTEDSYSFKRSHAIGYAMAIVLQMNKMTYSFCTN